MVSRAKEDAKAYEKAKQEMKQAREDEKLRLE